MRRTRIFLALALLAYITSVAAATRFTSAKGSSVAIKGTSTMHDWTMQGTTIDGIITTVPIDEWQSGTELSDVVVNIPVESIRSEHGKMDKLMADALKAKQHPTIRYRLTSATVEKPGSTFVVATRGKLTIAGVTRDVEMKVTGTRESAKRYTLTGTAPIRMSDYGIKPPTAMLGTIKTGNDVVVTFRWAVETTE